MLTQVMAPIKNIVWQRIGVYVGLFACLFTATALLQCLSGAFSSEFGSDPDEAAHYVTALMIRDYLASPHSENPMRFAESFYMHYPKVAFGTWPPLFHMIEAVWMLAMSPSRSSIMLFMAMWTALLGLSLYHVLAKRYSGPAAATAALLFLMVPTTRMASEMVMLDPALALFSFWAAVNFGNFLDTGRWQDSSRFGVFAALAIMTKYNGLDLALLPSFALVLSRRINMLRNWVFWLPAAIVVTICGPWYLAMSHFVAYAMQPMPGPDSIPPATLANTRNLLDLGGLAVSILVGAGIAHRILLPFQRNRVLGQDAALGALIASVFLFHSVLYPTSSARYLLPAVPAWIVFLAAGVVWTVSLIPKYLSISEVLRIVLAVALGCAFMSSRIPQRRHFGYDDVAEKIASNAGPKTSIVLVSADPEGEGMFISELAMREHRPGHYVLRASKVLASSTWMRENYRPFFRTPQQALRAVEEAGVSTIIIGNYSPEPPQHHQQLANALVNDSRNWRQMDWYSRPHGDEHRNRILVYQRLGPPPDAGPPKIKIDMKYTLGRSIGN